MFLLARERLDSSTIQIYLIFIRINTINFINEGLRLKGIFWEGPYHSIIFTNELADNLVEQLFFLVGHFELRIEHLLWLTLQL